MKETYRYKDREIETYRKRQVHRTREADKPKDRLCVSNFKSLHESSLR